VKLFEGQVVLVTGAGGGIGLATASAFGQAGASVIVADSNAPLLEIAADGLRSAGHQVLAVNCDVTDRGQVKAMIEQVVKTFGRLDAAFNNAGINCDGAPMAETEDDEFDNIVNVNLRGVWNCMKAEIRQMTAQGNGAIVNCSSIGGMRGSKGRAAYSASKFGVIGLTRAQRSIMPTRVSASTQCARVSLVIRPWRRGSPRTTIPTSSKPSWRPNRSDASASLKRSPLPYCGCVARPRVS
jgi:NAD(P)-dependent dehydrogenase (short-subunit alcohol dehydrogenase family)